MKKFIAIIAAIALIATMSVSVFAADATLTDAKLVSDKQAVTAVYAGTSDKGADEIHLDITWTDVEFKYTVDALEWDEAQSKWVDSTTGASWSDAIAKVDVATRSSCAVTVTATYEETNVAAAFADGGVANLVAADAAEGTKAATLTLNCTETDPITETVEAGKITITVAKA